MWREPHGAFCGRSIPEPGTYTLVASALLGLGSLTIIRRWRRETFAPSSPVADGSMQTRLVATSSSGGEAPSMD